VYAFLAGHFRMEGGGQQLAGTHCNNSSRPGERHCVGRLVGVGRFHLGQDLHICTHLLHPGAPDEDCMHRLHARLRGAEVQSLEVQVGFEGLALPAEGVAADGDVQAAERLLGCAGKIGCGIGDPVREQDHACARSKDRQTLCYVLPKGVGKVEGARQFVDRGGLAAGDDEAVQAIELLGTADSNALCAGGFRSAEVLAEVSLQGQDTNPQA